MPQTKCRNRYNIKCDYNFCSYWETGLQESFNNEGVEVKTFGADNILKITTSYLIDDESDDADINVKNQLVSGLKNITNLDFTEDDTMGDERNFTISSSSKVGATIADDIQNSSIYSGLLALIAIFVYILIRFRKWQFSLGAVAAVFHDVLIVLGIFSITYTFMNAGQLWDTTMNPEERTLRKVIIEPGGEADRVFTI